MAADSDPTSRKGSAGASDDIVALARKAVKSLKEKKDGYQAIGEATIAAAAENLCQAAIRMDGSDAETVIADLPGRGFGIDDIAGRIIPQAARRLGEMWMEDEVTFPEVSMAAARLQAMIRDLFDDSAMIDPDAPRIALIVSVAETHTLGAIVLTGMMRRLGLQVDLCLGRPAAEVRAMLAGTDVDLVMISAASLEALPETSRLLTILRDELQLGAPIVVGGPVTDYAREGYGLDRADMITTDPMQALMTFGLVSGRSDGGAPDRNDSRPGLPVQ